MSRHRRRSFLSCFLVTLLSFLLLPACSPSPTEASAAKTEDAGQPTKITIAIVPSEDTERVVESFENIRAHMEKELGMPVEMRAVTDYSSVIEAMRSKKVEVAWLGPLSYVLAKREAGAEPFAVGQEPGSSPTYHSLLVVRTNNPAQSIADLKGLKVALVDPASTSGNLVPRNAVLEATGQEAEAFFSQVVYAGSHDASLLALKNGSVDVAAVQEVTYEEMGKKGLIDPTQFRVLWQSDALPESPLCVRSDLPQALKESIAKTILTAHEKGVRLSIAGMGDYEKFVAAKPEDYAGIEAMADRMKLTAEQLAR